MNVLKHIFIEKYVPKVLHKYKTDKFILIPINNETISTYSSITKLNDSDVHRLFGWAITKIKKNYKRLNMCCCTIPQA